MSHSVALHNVAVLQVDAHSHQVLKSSSYCVMETVGLQSVCFKFLPLSFREGQQTQTLDCNQCSIPAVGRQVAAQRQFPGPSPCNLVPRYELHTK